MATDTAMQYHCARHSTTDTSKDYTVYRCKRITAQYRIITMSFEALGRNITAWVELKLFLLGM